MISAGVYHLRTDKALIGLALHLDRMTDLASSNTLMTGIGWLADPYASLELGKGVSWDTSLSYGGSANDIDEAIWDGRFNTNRWVFDTQLSDQ